MKIYPTRIIENRHSGSHFRRVIRIFMPTYSIGLSISCRIVIVTRGVLLLHRNFFRQNYDFFSKKYNTWPRVGSQFFDIVTIVFACTSKTPGSAGMDMNTVDRNLWICISRIISLGLSKNNFLPVKSEHTITTVKSTWNYKK